MAFRALWPLLALLFSLPLQSAESQPRLWVSAPFLELQTGPGRGFPKFYAVERDQWVELIWRKTDWYRLRDRKGIEGWIPEEKLQQLRLTEVSSPSLRKTLRADYLQRDWEIGFAAGVFDGDPVVTLRGGYRFNRNLLGELGLSKSSGLFSSSNVYELGLVGRPMPEALWAPYFMLGVGYFDNRPTATLVDARQTQATMGVAGLGVRRYLARSFLLRVDLKDYLALVDDNQADEYLELVVGFSAFF